MKKGQPLLVNGRIHTGSYEKDGRKIYTMEIAADRIEFTGSSSNSSSKQKEEVNTSDTPFAGFDVSDLDLPF